MAEPWLAGRLPTGLGEEYYTFANAEGNLLNYTPPNVQWQAPLASRGESVFGNYVKAHDDLLRDYNRRLARPQGTTGALPLGTGGSPQGMSSYGLQHWNEFGQDEGRTLTQTPGVWGDPGRSPYIGYGGSVAGSAGAASNTGMLPQPSIAGYEYAYPVQSFYKREDALPQMYQLGREGDPFGRYFTTDINQYQYYPYSLADPADLLEDPQGESMYDILVGQSLIPTGKVQEGVFRV